MNVQLVGITALLAYAGVLNGEFAEGRFVRELQQASDQCQGLVVNTTCFTCTDEGATITVENGGCLCSSGVCLAAPVGNLGDTSPAPPLTGSAEDDNDFTDDDDTDDDFTDDDSDDD